MTWETTRAILRLAAKGHEPRGIAARLGLNIQDVAAVYNRHAHKIQSLRRIWMNANGLGLKTSPMTGSGGRTSATVLDFDRGNAKR